MDQFNLNVNVQEVNIKYLSIENKFSDIGCPGVKYTIEFGAMIFCKLDLID